MGSHARALMVATFAKDVALTVLTFERRCGSGSIDFETLYRGKHLNRAIEQLFLDLEASRYRRQQRQQNNSLNLLSFLWPN